MNYQKIEKRLKLIAQNEPNIILDCAKIDVFGGRSWPFIQSEMNSGRYVMRGMPTGLTHTKEMLAPNRPLKVLGFLLLGFIMTAIHSGSWWAFLFIPFTIIGGNLHRLLGALITIGSVVLLWWSLHANHDIVDICSAGLLFGALGSFRMGLNGWMFKALRENEVIFSFCFTMGWFWVEDQTTGNDYRFYPGTGSWGL